MKCKIYQIDREKDLKRACFGSLEEQIGKYGKVNESLYKLVFDGEVPEADDLGKLYEVLNIGRKLYGYTGRNLSISDIIVAGEEVHYVEPFGFAKLDSFSPVAEKEPRYAKALPVDVLRTRYEGASNGGISERYDRLLLLCEEGFEKVDLNDPPENLVIVVKRRLGGKCRDYIRPYAEPKKGNIGWMAGGSFAESSDSRFSDMIGFYGAVSIHDRQETQDQYDMLFD